MSDFSKWPAISRSYWGKIRPGKWVLIFLKNDDRTLYFQVEENKLGNVGNPFIVLRFPEKECDTILRGAEIERISPMFSPDEIRALAAVLGLLNE